MLERLAVEEFDVLVVGGGITGVGVALDAATRGLRTALVERDDFASGTSSKSSKLIHGGLRYLQQGDVKLVYQALRERQRLLRNAPHLVSILPFLIPVLTRDSVVSKKISKALGSAMWLYDLSGGWRIGKRHRRLDAEETFTHFPTLPPHKVSSGFLYYDATADDARLTLTIAQTAADEGAVVVNRCEVVQISTGASGRADGAVVRHNGVDTHVRARVVVAAAGVWSDHVRRLDEGQQPDSIRPAKGVHITIPWDKVRNDVAVVISVPGDKRSLFITPWNTRDDGSFTHVYVGTTDTDYDGPLDDPQCDGTDIDYILGTLNNSLTTSVSRADITGTWAGLRPLVKAAASGRTADLSRHHRVEVSDAGVIRVTGGKLTTYREMAQDAVDEALRQLGAKARCRTARLPLRGAPRGADRSSGDRLTRRYGTAATQIARLIEVDASLGNPLVAGLAYTRAEAVHAARHEMALTLCDVLLRRTRAHLEDRTACLDAAPAVAELLAGELGWDSAEQAAQLHEYHTICDAEITAAIPSERTS